MYGMPERLPGLEALAPLRELCSGLSDEELLLLFEELEVGDWRDRSADTDVRLDVVLN